MDLAYDHIAEQTYAGDRAATPTPPRPDGSTSQPPPAVARQNLQTELQETFKAFSNSPWASRLGGLWGTVRKQGESYYEGALREAEAAGSEALKGFSDLKQSIVNRTRSLSLGEDSTRSTEASSSNQARAGIAGDAAGDASLQENDTLIARFRTEAAKRLKEIEKAEDAADEALLRFGTNIRNFLRDAVAVAPPENQPPGESTLLFESKDSSGKRVIHASRLDAQIHVIHTTPASFTEDPITPAGQWAAFKDSFDIDKMTKDISVDLDKYPDLRRAMENLVPEKVEYRDFWCRYYFLRHVLQEQEDRRKALLQGTLADTSLSFSWGKRSRLTPRGVAPASNETEEVGWDEESEEEDNKQDEEGSAPPTPQRQISKFSEPKREGGAGGGSRAESSDSTATLPSSTAEHHHLKPEGRKSHDEKSVADSDASYDLVSGATSRSPGTPRDERPTGASALRGDEESDEEDWE